jgi:hypothetical protein
MSFPTLLDIAVFNGADGRALIDETIQAHPELLLGAAKRIKGQSYKTLVRTGLGNAGGSFRDANQGVSPHAHTHENRTVATYILNPRFECDKAVADRHEEGAGKYLALNALGTLEGEMQALAKQFYYGATLGHAKGFPGLLQSYDATNMVVDAAGTTDSVASSCWLVKFGELHVQWVWGEGGSFDFSEVRTESLPDPNDATKRLDGYVQTLLAYPGLQVGSRFSAVRIKKLTTDSGKGLTDDLIYQALEKFPSGIVPDVILCSRRSLRQLRGSRTATNATGTPAPLPAEVEGIPIRVTDAILNTETLAL